MVSDRRERLLGLGVFGAMALLHSTVAVSHYLLDGAPVGLPMLGALVVPLGLAAVTVALAVRVANADLPGKQCLRIAATGLVVGVGFGALAFLVVATHRIDRLVLSDVLVLVNDVALAGAVAGAALGLYRAEHDRKHEALADRTERLRVVNKLLRHDIRNDAAVVHTYANLLREDVGDHEAIEQILEKTDHVVELTQTARDADVGLGEAGVDGDGVDLGMVLQDAVERTRVDFPDATVTVAGELPTGVGVRADHVVVAVFTNLLRNAVQHNDGDAHVTVSAEVMAETVVVEVSDDGPGLPADLQETLFEAGTTDADDGTGLGLYLVQTLVDQYGGTVSVEENEPTGTTFTVELPRVDAPGA